MTINLPETHPTLGQPSKIFTYLDVQGHVYGASFRFDGPEGKTFRPYDALKKSWTLPDNPVPYNSEFPDNPVIIVEGEKCADCLRKFGFSGITSFGGSGSSGKTDWSSLKGKDVIIWPDYDDAGLKYSDTLKNTLRNVEVKSLRICKVNSKTLLKVIQQSPEANLQKENFLKKKMGGFLRENFLKKNEGGFLKETYTPITSIENLPNGWDVADAISEGWTKEHIQVFLDEAISIELKTQVSIEKPANDNWGEPNLNFLYRKNTPPTFPIDIFNFPIGNWLHKTAEGRAAPIDYVAGTLLSVSAALIGNSRKVSPWEGWSEPSILWIALVGSPSSGKSPAMDPVLEQVKKLEADDVPEYEDALLQFETEKLSAELAKSKWQEEAKASSSSGFSAPLMPKEAIEPDCPPRPRLITQDTTVEALCQTLTGQPKGILVNRDELAGWFSNFDRYNGGKGGDRAFWLECFGGKAFTKDRVKNGANPITIQNLSASIIGSIQPDRLESLLMKGDDDGLNSRFIYIYPDAVIRKRPQHLADNRVIERALKKLHQLKLDMDEDHTLKGRVIPLSSEASEVFEEWWSNQGKSTQDGKSSGWHGKTQGMALRLALVLTYLDWATEIDQPEPHEITSDTTKRVLNFIDNYLTPMAERAFGISAITEADQNTIKLAEWIMETKPERIVVRDVQRSGPFPSNIKADVIKSACFELSGFHWLKPDFVRHGENSGRQQTAFLINPTL